MKRVYELRGDRATENLQRKLAALNHYVQVGIPWVCDETGQIVRSADTGARVLDFFPKNARQFSRWTTERGKAKGLCNCTSVIRDLEARVGPFTTHGIDSLNGRPAELGLANQLFKAVRARAAEQKAGENYTDKIKRLKIERDMFEAAARAQAGFVVNALKENVQLRKEVKDLVKALDSARNVLIEHDADTEAQIQQRDHLISQLRKQISEAQRFEGVNRQ